MTLAMAVVCWFERARSKMLQARRTSEFEHSKHSLSVVDRVKLFNSSQLDMFFAQKRATRVVQQRAMVRNAWRYR
jgi:hypothetical protein